jgi:hypothetical protein
MRSKGQALFGTFLAMSRDVRARGALLSGAVTIASLRARLVIQAEAERAARRLKAD